MYTQGCYLDDCVQCGMHSLKSCYGVTHDTPGNSVAGRYTVIRCTPSDNQETLVAQAWEALDAHAQLRLITTCRVSKNLMYAVAATDDNLLQQNIDLISGSYNSWAWHNCSLANKCGVYVLMFINNIAPGLVQSREVIELMQNFHRYGAGRVILRFLELPADELNSSVIYEGRQLDMSRMVNHSGMYQPCPDYAARFLRNIQAFASTNKLKYGVCGKDNCLRMGKVGKYASHYFQRGD